MSVFTLAIGIVVAAVVITRVFVEERLLRAHLRRPQLIGTALDAGEACSEPQHMELQ
jgi:hypothetical protein